MTTINSSGDSTSVASLFPESRSLNVLTEANEGDGYEQSVSMDFLAIPADVSSVDEHSADMFSDDGTKYMDVITNVPASSSVNETVASASTADDSNVFNISWGGNDRPPTEIHPDEIEERLVPKRPLPKPRGIRKLPEPDPSPDGSLDENTLRRRKNTDAARKSRLKKILRIEQLEDKVATLQAENAKLVLSNALLESEKRSMNAKESEYKRRIKLLEDQINGQVGEC